MWATLALKSQSHTVIDHTIRPVVPVRCAVICSGRLLPDLLDNSTVLGMLHACTVHAVCVQRVCRVHVAGVAAKGAPQVPVPVLVLHGGKDEKTPPDLEGNKANARWCSVETKLFPDLAHGISDEELDVIAEWLARELCDRTTPSPATLIFGSAVGKGRSPSTKQNS